MTVDYRKRCVVRNGSFDRVYYGVTAAEYNAMSGFDDATDIQRVYDHSAGRGRQAGMVADVASTRYFYTPDLGLRDAVVREAAQGRIRR